MQRIPTSSCRTDALKLSFRAINRQSLQSPQSQRVYSICRNIRSIEWPTLQSSRLLRVVCSSSRNVARNTQSAKLVTPFVAYGVGCLWWVHTRSFALAAPTQCNDTTSIASVVETSLVVRNESTWERVRRVIQMLQRVIKLMLAFAPIVGFYPIASLLHTRDPNEDAKDAVLLALEHQDLPTGPLGWYYRMCLACVEWSGAAAIKMFQWAGSRPDMFGAEFSRVFSMLQDNTTPHEWKHTERALRDACKYFYSLDQSAGNCQEYSE